MLKLIIRLPKTADANQLMVNALALAHYKTCKPDYFKIKSYEVPDNDYSTDDLLSFEPVRAWDSSSYSEDCKAGINEYEVLEQVFIKGKK